MSQQTIHCPSAQPDMPGAKVHGVVDAVTGRILHLDAPVPVTPELLASTAPLLPTEVLRFTAECQGGRCIHFRNSQCNLADKLVQILPPNSEGLPRCAIRSSCRWFLQRGRDACLRCNEIVTDEYTRGELMGQLAEV
jgi:hypothetical protein